MTYILISGQSNTGKTSTCRRLRGLIDQDPTYTKHAAPRIPRTLKHDFIEHYEKDGIHIVLSSQSDYDRSMERLAWYIDRLTASGIYPAVIITSIRETDRHKDQASRMRALLDEVAAREPNGTATGATDFESFYDTRVRTKPIPRPMRQRQSCSGRRCCAWSGSRTPRTARSRGTGTTPPRPPSARSTPPSRGRNGQG